MKIQLKEIINNLHHLSTLGNYDLEITKSFDLAMIIKKLENFINSYNEARNKIVKQNRTEKIDEKGRKTYEIIDKEKVNEEIDKLLKQEIDLNVKPMSLKQLGIEKIKPNMLAGLHWLIIK